VRLIAEAHLKSITDHGPSARATHEIQPVEVDYAMAGRG
jgi:hypothetical protein